MKYQVQGESFEWDDSKALANLAKHDGISFETACEVFFDPFMVYQDASTNDDAREAVIGNTESRQLLFVVFVEIQEEVIRIISARLATAHERRSYDDQ